MDVLIALWIIVSIVFIIRLYNYYKPTIDFITTNSGVEVLLWYNKYEDSFVQRTYIKLI